MAFTLVLVPKPSPNAPHDEMNKWGTFHQLAKVDALKEMAGVLCIDDTAWIFDTTKNGTKR